MRQLNTLELDRLLTIANPNDETIFGVIGRMEVLLDLFSREKRYHSLLPFLKTYYFVTKAGAGEYIRGRHYFTNIRDYEHLDVYFASLYFNNLRAYLTEGLYETPWKAYFDYCHSKRGIPFLQMLLGVNAHINANLYTALVDLDYTHETDFFLVNDILAEVVPDVMHFMIFSEHDFFSAGSLIMKKFFDSQFHAVIGKWRKEAWINAVERREQQLNQKGNEELYLRICTKTETIGRKLIHDFQTLAVLPTLPTLIDSLRGPSIIGAKTLKQQEVA